MTDSQALELHTTPAGDLDLPSLGRVLAACGYFRDAQKVSQAITKILAGKEIGIGPIAALRNIHIVEGKVELSATLIAALIRRHDRYDYRVCEMSDDAVEIEILRDGTACGRSRFTMTDAKTAGLVKPRSAWERYPRNMLFARALSNAARWYAPDVFQGEVYTEGEIHDAQLVVDPDDDPPTIPITPPDDPEPHSPSEASAEPDGRETAMKRLHAEAHRYGISHDELSAWAARDLGVESMTDLDTNQLDGMLEGLRAGEVPAAAGWPHTPASGPEERSRPPQWTVIFSRARERGANDNTVKNLFRKRYGFDYEHATRDQAQDFGAWLRTWLTRTPVPA